MEDYKIYSIGFDELQRTDIFLNKDKPFIIEINKNGVNFEFLMRIKSDSDKAIIFGSGAYDATSDLNPPIFQRHKWMKHFDETLIYFNDPTLYLGKINIGWGFGSATSYYLEEIAEILSILLEKIKIDRKKVLLYGSSAGGFMALMLGGILKGAHVLVNNPQTIVWNYYDRHVNSMFNVTMPALNRDEIIETYKHRLNVYEFYKKNEYVPDIKYIQNSASERDIVAHLNPFILSLNKLDQTFFEQNIDIMLYADEELGHTPLRVDDTVYYIKDKLNKI
ncbi:alpha/beta hydrolase [Paraliobacillus zengyii]|uniref:alpha/beta hydrolase n=1 Tax=Paraliobacillus zengyii TaxID=2213194 RepID=UPI000E3BAD6E|nr:alpha/beta hydrolase [Paraliobacillus zengyii]